MTDPLLPDDRLAEPEPEPEADALGTTMVLTGEGWERAAYIDPEADWLLQDDGSWVSPDGQTRSWSLVGPETERS